jgi:hypothetical protein
MITGLERRGVNVIDDASRLSAGASVQTFREGGQLTMVYDSSSSSFLDVLHDTRHIAQIQRAELQGIDVLGSPRLRGLAEYGAYGYEVRLGQRYGFSSEYMGYARGQIYYRDRCKNHQIPTVTITLMRPLMADIRARLTLVPSISNTLAL